MEPVVEPCLDPLDLLRGDEIDLVEDQHVGECHLAELQFHHLGGSEYLLRVHDAHDAVQPDAVPHASSMKVSAMPDGSATPLASSRMYSGRSGRAHHLRHRGDQIVADVAADTAVGEIDDIPLAFDADNEFGINVDRTEVVHQHRDPKAVIAGENAVQQRRLARAKKASQDRQWDDVCGVVGRGQLARSGIS